MVKQRALPRQEGPPDSPCQAMECFHAHAEKVQERCFVSEWNFSELRVHCRKAQHTMASPCTGIVRTLCSETHPRFCFLPSRHSLLSAQPRIPSCSAGVELGSTGPWCAAGHTSAPELSQAPVPPALLPSCSYIQGMQLPPFCGSGWVFQTQEIILWAAWEKTEF